MILENAWLQKIHELAELLDLVYDKSTGEIWLYDNDLEVFDSVPNNEEDVFEILYQNRIDGSLASKVKSIKILLKKTKFDKFWKQKKTSPLFKNLCKLRADRLRTFYVGPLEKIQPKIQDRFGGDYPWIFYLRENPDDHGIVIIRPKVYPLHKKGNKRNEKIAIAWRREDKKLSLLNTRLYDGKLHQVFKENLHKNFLSIEPLEEKGKVVGYKQIPPREKADIESIVKRLKNEIPPPILPPVDIGIVTTLSEELQAVIERFRLDEGKHANYACGCFQNKNRVLSIVATKCTDSGSIQSAITTANLLNEWNPKNVFLIGRCAAYFKVKKKKVDIKINDVIISKAIWNYEYQTIKGLKKREQSTRSNKCTGNLLALAEKLTRLDDYIVMDSNDLPEMWKKDCKTKKFKAYCDCSACGSKVIKSGVDWFKGTQKSLGQNKIIATEMEAEGVGTAVELHESKPQFLMIKGVSDYGNKGKSDTHKKSSSRVAAHFLYKMLKIDGSEKFLGCQNDE